MPQQTAQLKSQLISSPRCQAKWSVHWFQSQLSNNSSLWAGPADAELSSGALTTLQNCRQTNRCCFHTLELGGVLLCCTIPLEPDASANTDALLFLTKGFLAPSHWPETLAFLLILLSGIFWLVNYCFTISSSRIANFKPKAINSSKNKNGVSGGGHAWAHWFVLSNLKTLFYHDWLQTHTHMHSMIFKHRMSTQICPVGLIIQSYYECHLEVLMVEVRPSFAMYNLYFHIK